MGAKESVRERIFGSISDGVQDLLYYDRREDHEWLRMNEIELAIENKDITVEEMVDCFKSQLEGQLNFPAQPLGE